MVRTAAELRRRNLKRSAGQRAWSSSSSRLPRARLPPDEVQRRPAVQSTYRYVDSAPAVKCATCGARLTPGWVERCRMNAALRIISEDPRFWRCFQCVRASWQTKAVGASLPARG
jgi:hypothetical protein